MVVLVECMRWRGRGRRRLVLLTGCMRCRGVRLWVSCLGGKDFCVKIDRIKMKEGEERGAWLRVKEEKGGKDGWVDPFLRR